MGNGLRRPRHLRHARSLSDNPGLPAIYRTPIGDNSIDIEREIEVFRQKTIKQHPDIEESFRDRQTLITQFLGNFHLELLDVKGSRRDVAARQGFIDETIRRQSTETQIKNHSDFYLSKTYRQFYDDCDRAVRESGQDIGEIRRLFEEDSIGNRGKMAELMLPAYIQLRKRGYSMQDLRN
ncbi:MAG: hypothetical protein GF334_08925 [Candidatus Altiarchaeales archaeon]|nr:hypothetical protein [Candidatus Altiarchaeales archaeon]